MGNICMKTLFDNFTKAFLLFICFLANCLINEWTRCSLINYLQDKEVNAVCKNNRMKRKSRLPSAGKWGDMWTKGRRRCHWRHGPGRSQGRDEMVTFLLVLPPFFPFNTFPRRPKLFFSTVYKFELLLLFWSTPISLDFCWCNCRITSFSLCTYGCWTSTESPQESAYAARCHLIICFVCICSLIYETAIFHSATAIITFLQLLSFWRTFFFVYIYLAVGCSRF